MEMINLFPVCLKVQSRQEGQPHRAPLAENLGSRYGLDAAHGLGALPAIVFLSGTSAGSSQEPLLEEPLHPGKVG